MIPTARSNWFCSFILVILKVGQKVKANWCPQFEPLPIELSVAWLVSSGWKSTAAAPGGQIYQAAWWICQVLPGRETVHPVVVEACRNLTEFHRIPDFHPWGTSMFTFSAGWTCKLWCPYLVSRQSVSTKEIILRFSLHTFLQMFLLNPFNQFCHHIKGWNTCSESRVYQFNNQSLQGLLRPSPDWRDSFRKFMLEFHQGMISKQHSGN